MRDLTPKHCKVCGRTQNGVVIIDKHHVYPSHLAEVWVGRTSQVFVFLCRPCHDVVHWRGGLSRARRRGKYEYVAIFAHPQLREAIGLYRRIIRELELHSRLLHSGVSLDELPPLSYI